MSKADFMAASWVRFFLCFVVVAGLAGCGGSSNGGSGGGGGNPTIVTYTFKGAMPAAVATQIGTGAFTQATLDSGTLTISVPSGTTDYAVAYSCPSTTLPGLTGNGELVIEASTLDGTSIARSCGAATSSGTATVQINVAAIPGASIVFIGDSLLPSVQPWLGNTLTLSLQLQTGTHDVPIYVIDASASVVATRILRSQTVPGALNGGDTVTFSTSDETVLEPITDSNIPAGFLPGISLVAYETSDGNGASLSIGNFTQYRAMPVAAYESGDYYMFDVVAHSATTPTEEVGVETLTSSAGAQSFTFPAPWSYAGPAAAALPTFNFAYTAFSGMSNVSKYATLEWSPMANSTNVITVDASANYRNGATSITVPDLSGLTGFLAPAPSGTTIIWRASVRQGNPFLTTPPAGAVQFVQNAGAYTEP